MRVGLERTACRDFRRAVRFAFFLAKQRHSPLTWHRRRHSSGNDGRHRPVRRRHDAPPSRERKAQGYADGVRLLCSQGEPNWNKSTRPLPPSGQGPARGGRILPPRVPRPPPCSPRRSASQAPPRGRRSSTNYTAISFDFWRMNIATCGRPAIGSSGSSTSRWSFRSSRLLVRG